MDVYLLYAYVGAVCAVVIAIILNRVKTTEYKETVDATFCNALMFFILFCIIDAAWGLIGSPALFANRVAYTVATYGFHIMAAFASFICSGYVVHHLRLKVGMKRAFKVIRSVLLTAQMALIVQNQFTGFFFTIDENSVYHSNFLRPASFLLQFCHYIPVIVYSLFKLSRNEKSKEASYLYSSSLIFTALPLIFGALQMHYPDGSFYSLGFLITSVTMYAFNVTAQRESYLAVYYAAEEYKKSKERIEEALSRAESANAAKTDFLANMSHDIRTPINGIMGMVTLAKKEPMSDTLSEYIKKIDIASRHLLSLVNDVLDMSRIERGKAELVLDATDIRVIIDNCTSIIQGQIEERNLNFVKICDSIVHTRVRADILRVRQILINILGNAVKFTPNEGSVTFETKEVSFDGKTVEYEFTVRDTGVGMSSEFQEHIFEAFSQENNVSRANYQGTGLGMAITYQFVKLMNGSIKVESAVGKGSTFTVTLPFEVQAEEKTVTSGVKKADTDASVDGVRILLVEDNELNMEIAHTLLEANGAIITEASNGREARDVFVSNPEGSFDVILMDIMMPEMNGYEATRAIRASSKADARTIPIIAMTANAFAEDKIKAEEAGMDAHTSKPIDFPALVSKISELLGER